MTDVVIVDGIEVVILSDTEQEVIEVGVQGPPGTQGPAGNPGTPGADGADGVGVPAGGTVGQLLAKLSGTDYATQWIDPPSAGSSIALWNPLVNGAFGIKQDPVTSNADDTYAHDQWYVLTQTGAIAVSTLTNVEDGLPTMARLTQSQVTSQRMGYAQIVEGENCKHLRGKQVTFRFGRERMSAAGNIRIAVLEWTGAEDVVTSDVVNSWTSGTYTPGNFFLGSNLAVSGIVAQTLAANTLTDGTALTVTLGSTFNNLIVFVWTESAVAQNVTLDLGLAQIDMGATARPFEHRPYAIELMLCHRYYYRINATAVNQSYGNGYTVSTTVAAGVTPFPVAMRAPPTALEQSGTAANYSIATPTLVYVCTAVPVFNAATTWNATTVFTSSGMTASIPGLLHSNAIGAYLAWSARL